MSLHFIRTEKFKTSIICILLRRRLDRKEVTKNALIANIIKNGSAKYPSIREINNTTEEMFGSIFDIQVVKKNEEQIIQFYFEFLGKDDNLLSEAFSFLSEIIYNPLTEGGGFKSSNFRLEKDILSQIIKGRVNDRINYTKERCVEIMCHKEPFGIYADGYIDELEEIENEELFEHFGYVLQNSPIEVIVLGNNNEKEIESLYNKYFNERAGFQEKIKTSNSVVKKTSTKHKIDYLNILQNKICFGLRLNRKSKGEDFYKSLVFNEILGGGSSSLLFRKVREEENMCYYIHSILYRYKSIILIESGIDNTEKAEVIITKQIESISQGNFDDTDVEEAKRSVIKKYNSIKDKQSAMLDFYISNYLVEDSSTLDDCIAEIEKITYGDILEVAGDLYIDTIYCLMDGEIN